MAIFYVQLYLQFCGRCIWNSKHYRILFLTTAIHFPQDETKCAYLLQYHSNLSNLGRVIYKFYRHIVSIITHLLFYRHYYDARCLFVLLIIVTCRLVQIVYQIIRWCNFWYATRMHNIRNCLCIKRPKPSLNIKFIIKYR